MVATGICHTDITMGSFLPPEMFPNVFGHEGAGVVEEVGAAVDGLEPGDHVVMSFRSCRDCAKCNAGLVGYCDQTLLLNYMGMRMDGSHLPPAGRQPGLRQLLRPVQPGRARAGVRRQLRQGRPRPRPDPPGAVRLRLPDRRRHRPQRAAARRPTTAWSCTASARSGWPRSRRPRPRASSRSSPSTRWPAGARWRRGSAPPPWTRPRCEQRGRPGQGADRRRRDVRHRHHGDPRGGEAGPAVARRPRHPGRARPRRRGVRPRRDRPAPGRQDRDGRRSRATPTRRRWCRG